MTSETTAEAWVELPHLEPPPPGTGRGYNFGFVANMGRLISAHGRIAPHFGRLFSEIMFTPGALSRQEREMVAAVAAAAQDCHY